MKIKAEFSGGLEIIFQNKTIAIEINKDGEITVSDVVNELKKHILERPEFFLTKEGEVRPGILVLVNDADWEIYEKEHTIVSNGDSISFISTLHGG